MSTVFSKQGLPEDLLTSKIEGERKLKVDADLAAQLAVAFIESESTNAKMLTQLKLLNARFEEAFNTGLEEKDCE